MGHSGDESMSMQTNGKCTYRNKTDLGRLLCTCGSVQ